MNEKMVLLDKLHLRKLHKRKRWITMSSSSLGPKPNQFKKVFTQLLLYIYYNVWLCNKRINLKKKNKNMCEFWISAVPVWHHSIYSILTRQIKCALGYRDILYVSLTKVHVVTYVVLNFARVSRPHDILL